MDTRNFDGQLALWSLAVVGVMLAGCGGGDTDPASETTSVNVPTTAVAVEDGQTSTTAAVDQTPDTTVAPSEGSSVDENTAIVIIGSETYQFVVIDGGTCDPDFFGSFRAFLTHVDENGEPVPLADAPGVNENITISLSVAEDVQGAVGGPFGGTDWTVNWEGAEYQVDGATATGTMTFIDGDGTSTEGSFEVVCAGD